MTGVDLFAGAGGFTTGAELAGVRIAWAANHWPVAVQTHAENHPHVQHVCQDLHQANWADLPSHDLLLASPACQGHTKARGKERPHHDASRSTAWAVIAAVEVCRPPVVIVENVEEMADWALMPAWRMAMNDMGYAISAQVLDAADFGVPQHRRRLFLVCTRSTVPVQLDLQRWHRPHVPAANVIDFDTGRWSPIRRPKRAATTLARIKAGRAKHGSRFLIAYYGSAKGGRSLNRPIGTLTTRARYAVIDGERMRMVTPEEARAAMSFPADYRLPKNIKTAHHLIGNAVPPLLARAVISAVCEAA
jgi:DNA (cytosine-5)-methyltransferase 1